MNFVFISAILVTATSALALPRSSSFWNAKSNVFFPTIVGGDVARPNELPYQLSLQYDGVHSCGATILNENFALTAAHCVVYMEAEHFTIVAGEHALDADDGTEQVRQVSEIVYHAEYRPFLYYNDIALLKLASPLDLNSFVKFVDLPPADFDATGLALVSGWGHENSGGTNSNLLRKVWVPIIPDDLCIALYNDVEVIGTMICAGVIEGGKDACQNDSGGPLVLNIDEVPTLVGIVSWGYRCAEPYKPGVYTEVSRYIHWIREHMI